MFMMMNHLFLQTHYFSLDNILLSPHIAGVTQEATIRMSKQAVQNVLDVFDDKVDPEVIINKNVL